MKKHIVSIPFYLWMTIALTSCEYKNEEGELVISKSTGNSMVVNGCSYEKATIHLSPQQTLVIPKEALVERTEQGDKIEIYLEKELFFLGHPPYPMHIRDAREYMGIVTREENNAMIIATYGEWDSHIEGGSSIRLLMRVPDSIKSEKKKQLSGENSLAHYDDDPNWMKLIDSPEFKKCYWYGPIKPKEGWEKIETQPDKKHRAKRKEL